MLNPIHDLFITLCKNFNDSCRVPEMNLEPKLSPKNLTELKQLIAQVEKSYEIISKSKRYKHNNKIKSLKSKIDFLKNRISSLSI